MIIGNLVILGRIKNNITKGKKVKWEIRVVLLS
jgi:hypothetical protein